jgi:hypothetical protein
MQQQEQQQAAALRKQEAEQAIVKLNPEETAGQFIGGKFVPLVTGKPKPMTEAQQLEAELKQYATEVEADKALDVNRIVRPFQRLPKGVPIGAKRTGGKTPDGKEVFELNGKKYVGE